MNRPSAPKREQMGDFYAHIYWVHCTNPSNMEIIPHHRASYISIAPKFGERHCAMGFVTRPNNIPKGS